MISLGIVILAGCASVSVTDVTDAGGAPKAVPRNIYVEEFATPDDAMKVDRTGADLQTFTQKLRTLLASETVIRLCKHVAPAQILLPHSPIPHEGWVIRGRFVRVNQGSRALRAIIGFGAGGTKMETEVEVYDLSRPSSKPFLKFSTTGGSNAEPGGIFNLDPVTLPEGVLLGAATTLGHGVSEDTTRTAREITAALSEYAVDQGMLPPQNALQTKKPM